MHRSIAKSALSSWLTTDKYRLRHRCSGRFLEANQGQFERMMDTLHAFPVPRVDLEHVQRWSGGVEEFPLIDIVLQIVSRGAPVPVTG